MKKVLYFLPLIIGVALYIFLGIESSFDSINHFAWIALAMLFVAGLLMNNNKWWGCFLGITIGIFLIYMGGQETGQIIKETPFGIIMCIYYIVCAIFSYKESITKNIKIK